MNYWFNGLTSFLAYEVVADEEKTEESPRFASNISLYSTKISIYVYI